MSRVISGLRFARSFLTPSNAVLEQELDFELGAKMGIQVEWVIGSLGNISETPGADAASTGQQSLHLEEDATEDIPIATGEDAVNVDSEMFFHQQANFVHDFTTSGGAFLPQPVHLWVPYNGELKTTRNITHRAEGSGATREYRAAVLIAYKLIELDDREILANLSSRR